MTSVAHMTQPHQARQRRRWATSTACRAKHHRRPETRAVTVAQKAGSRGPSAPRERLLCASFLSQPRTARRVHAEVTLGFPSASSASGSKAPVKGLAANMLPAHTPPAAPANVLHSGAPLRSTRPSTSSCSTCGGLVAHSAGGGARFANTCSVQRLPAARARRATSAARGAFRGHESACIGMTRRREWRAIEQRTSSYTFYSSTAVRSARPVDCPATSNSQKNTFSRDGGRGRRGRASSRCVARPSASF